MSVTDVLLEAVQRDAKDLDNGGAARVFALVAMYRREVEAREQVEGERATYRAECERLSSTITTLTAEVERLRGEVERARARKTPRVEAMARRDALVDSYRNAASVAFRAERDAAIARAEKAEASICKTCLDEDRTVALIASWLARKANKARQVGRTGEQQVFGELAADIRNGAWRAKEPV